MKVGPRAPARPSRHGRPAPHGACCRARARLRRRRGRGLPGPAVGDRGIAGLRGRALAARRRGRAALRRDLAGRQRLRCRARLLGVVVGRSRGRTRRVRVPAAWDRRDGVRDRGAAGPRACAAGDDGEPRDPDLAVRRTLSRAAGRALQRRAQERDPQRRVRLHHHDGPRRPGARGQPRGRADLRLQLRRDGRARPRRPDHPAAPARRAPARARPLPAHRDQHGRRASARARGDAQGRQRVPDRGRRHPRRPPRAAAVRRLSARRHRGARARGGPAPAGRRAGRAAARGDCGGGDVGPATRVRGRHRGGRAPARRAEREHGALRPRRGRRHRRRRLERRRRADRAGRPRRADRRGHRLRPRAPQRRARPDRLLHARSASRRRICRGSASSARSPRRSSSTAACGGT